MKIFVNHIEQELATELHLKDLLNSLSPKKPFAISLNSTFIPKTDYENIMLKELDQIEIISPVTGG
jgi:thiamine biosynthesis protein ThiS